MKNSLFITSDECKPIVVVSGWSIVNVSKMHWPFVPFSHYRQTRTCQSQLGVYIVLFPLCYVTAGKSTSRGKLAACQSSSRHVAGWNRGKWRCCTTSIILQMMSLFVIFARSICSLATFLWAFFVRNITHMD